MTNTSLQAPRDTGGVTDKNDIILSAYSQLRISGITRNPTPDDLELALSRLEDMAAEWDLSSNSGGFFFEDTPDPNSPSGVIRGYRNAYATNLAVRLIPDFNKDVPQVLMGQASQSVSAMRNSIAAQRIREVPYPNRMPIGSGTLSRFSRWAKFYRSEDGPPLANTSASIFYGATMDFTQHYDAYLNDGETIASYALTVDSGLTVTAQALASPNITFTVKATSTTNSKTETVQQVTIIATTSAARIDIRRFYVQIVPTGAT